MSLSSALIDTRRELAAQEKKPEKAPPKFDRTAHYGEVGGEDGVKYVQGNAYFNARGDFVRWAPAAAVLKPLTKEQEMDRQRRLRASKKLFGAKLVKATDSIPDEVIEAQRENARALAAEQNAG